MLRSGIAGSYGRSLFSFLRNFHTVSIGGTGIYIPTNGIRGFSFFAPSPVFVVCRHFDDGPSVVLICIFVIINNIEHLFICFFAHLYVFFGEMSI